MDGFMPPSVEQVQAQAQQPQGAPQSGFLDTAGAVARDIGTGITELPRAAVRGVVEAGNEALQTASSIPSPLGLARQGLAGAARMVGAPEGVQQFLDAPTSQEQAQAGIQARAKQGILPNVAEPKSTTGQVAATVTQFITGMVGASKVTRLGGIKGGFVNGAIADAVAFDPHQKRLSNLVQDYPALQNPVTEFLASKPEDPEALGRLKNAIEGAGIGAVAEGLFWGIRSWAASRRGDLKLADEFAQKADDVTPDRMPAPGGAPAVEATVSSSIRKDEVTIPKAANDDAVISSPAESPRIETAPDEATQVVRDAQPLVNPNREALARSIADEVATTRRGSEVLGDDAVPRATMGEMPKGDVRRYDWSAAGDVDGFIATARTVARETRGQMQAGRPEDVVTWKQAEEGARKLAEEYGAEPALLLGQLHRKATDMAIVSEETTAFVTMTRRLNADVTEMAKAVNEGRLLEGYQTTDEMAEAFQRSAALLADVTASMQGIRTGFGRGLNILKMADNIDPQLIWQQKNNLDELARTIVAFADDPAGMAHALRKHYEPTAMDRVATYYSANLLWSPDTHAVNILSNAARALSLPVERMVGGALTGRGDMMALGARQLVAMPSVLLDSLKMAGRAFKLGRPVLDPGSFKVAAGGTGEAATNRIFAPNEAWGDVQKFGAELANKLWQVQQLSHRALGAQDEFFKQLMARSLITAEGTAKGLKQGLKGDELRGFVRREMTEAFEADGAIIRADALEQARRATFTEDLGPGILQDIQIGLAKYPALRVLALPFFKTPVNLFKQSMRWTPGINFLVRDVRTRYAMGGEEQAKVLGEMGLGAMIWGTAWSLAASGAITDGGPIGDQNQRKMTNSGWRPYSIVKENEDGSTNYIPLNNAEPFGMVLGLAADLHRAFEQKDATPDLEDAAMAVFHSIVRNVQDRNFFQGFANLLGAFNREGDTSGVKKVAGSIVGGMVPFSSGINFANQFNDPIMRDARTILDQVMRRMPGMSDELPARRNWIGEAVERQPRLMTTEKPDPLADLLNASIEVTGKGPDAPSPFIQATGRVARIDLRTAKLKDGRNAYDVYMDYIQQPRPGGETLRQVMEREVAKPGFQALKDGGSTERGTKMSVLVGIRKRFQTAAQARLMKEHPELREQLAEAVNKVQGARAVRGRLMQQYQEEDEAGPE
jgi:hypothetical protein